MSYTPRLRTQLGKGTKVPGGTQGARDCGIRAFQHGFGYLTHDKAVPWVQSIRNRMGRPGPTGTNIWDMEQAALTYDDWLDERGRKPIRLYKKFSKAAIRKAVQAGHIVTLAVDYGEWNERMGKTGDPNYRGGHAIDVLGEKRWPDGTVVWQVFDSLEDNRRNEIPQGPKWRPRWKVLKAAEAWARKTSGTQVVGGVFRGGGKR